MPRSCRKPLSPGMRKGARFALRRPATTVRLMQVLEAFGAVITALQRHQPFVEPLGPPVKGEFYVTPGTVELCAQCFCTRSRIHRGCDPLVGFAVQKFGFYLHLPNANIGARN